MLPEARIRCTVFPVLYFGRDVLIPIALATLLTFLLAPVVSRLERYHLGKTIPALGVLLVTREGKFDELWVE